MNVPNILVADILKSFTGPYPNSHSEADFNVKDGGTEIRCVKCGAAPI